MRDKNSEKKVSMKDATFFNFLANAILSPLFTRATAKERKNSLMQCGKKFFFFVFLFLSFFLSFFLSLSFLLFFSLFLSLLLYFILSLLSFSSFSLFLVFIFLSLFHLSFSLCSSFFCLKTQHLANFLLSFSFFSFFNQATNHNFKLKESKWLGWKNEGFARRTNAAVTF